MFGVRSGLDFVDRVSHNQSDEVNDYELQIKYSEINVRGISQFTSF